VDSDDAAITTAIISMAKSLNLKVIAEGVETEEQRSFLRLHQCDEIQGYYFSKPLSAEDAAERLRCASSRRDRFFESTGLTQAPQRQHRQAALRAISAASSTNA